MKTYLIFYIFFPMLYCTHLYCKGDVGNAVIDTKGKIVVALFSVCNKQTGVS